MVIHNAHEKQFKFGGFNPPKIVSHVLFMKAGCMPNCQISGYIVYVYRALLFAAVPELMFEALPPMVPVGYEVIFIICVITAQPIANFFQLVHILDDGMEVIVATENNSNSHRRFSVAFLLRNPTFPEDDGAVYQCQATNDIGLAVLNVTIVVQGEPC